MVFFCNRIVITDLIIIVAEDTIVKAGTAPASTSLRGFAKHLTLRSRIAKAEVSSIYWIQYLCDVLTTTKCGQQPSVKASNHNKGKENSQCEQNNVGVFWVCLFFFCFLVLFLLFLFVSSFVLVWFFHF